MNLHYIQAKAAGTKCSQIHHHNGLPTGLHRTQIMNKPVLFWGEIKKFGANFDNKGFLRFNCKKNYNAI